MKQFDKRTVTSLALAFATSATLPLGRAAHAGSWTFQVKGTGTVTTSNPAEPNPSTNNWNPEDNDSWVTSRGLSYPDPDYIGKKIQAKTNGSFTLEATFTPSAGETLPASVNVLIKAEAWVSGSKRSVADTTFSLSASALGASAVDKYVEGGVRKEANTGLLLKLSTQGATHLPNGKYKITKSIGQGSAEAEGTIGTAPGEMTEAEPGGPEATQNSDYGAAVGAGVSATAQEDGRTLTLSRGIAAKRKGEPGVEIDEARDEWIDTDGTAHGQTRWSYHETVLSYSNNIEYQTDPVPVNVVIGAQLGGPWAPYNLLEGKWSSLHPNDLFPPYNNPQSHSHIEVMPDGGARLDTVGRSVYGLPQPTGWYDEPTAGSEVTVTYDLKDLSASSPVAATAKYVLRLHNEWENPTDNTPARTHESRRLDLNVPRIDGPQTDKSWTFANITAGLTSELKTTFGANFKLKDWFTAGGSFETTAKLEIESSYEASAPKITLKSGESAIPCINYIVKTQHKLVDHFILSGWDRNEARSDGKFPQSADMPVDIRDVSANWHRLDQGQPVNP